MIQFLKLLFRNRLAGLGAVVLTFILLLALLTPILPLYAALLGWPFIGH